MTTERRRTRRGAAASAELITIYWRDIPAQVTARAGDEKVAIELAPRFQTAIDRAAAVAEKVTYDQYIGEWRREAAPCEEDIQRVAEHAVRELESSFTRERLTALIDSGGFLQSDTSRQHRSGGES